MKNASWKIAFQWGMLYALLILLWLPLESTVGLHEEYVKYRVLLTNVKYIPIFLIFLGALRSYRKESSEGPYPYSQAFLDGLKLTAAATLLSIPTQYLSLRFLAPSFLSQMEAAMTEGRWMTAAEAGQYFEFQNYFIQSVLAIPATGLMITAIVAVFVSQNSHRAAS